MTIHKMTVLALGFAASTVIPTASFGVTLSTLVAGSTLTQGDVTFGDFAFADFFSTSSDRPFDGDRVVSASQIDVTTTATEGTVSLKATLDPAIDISGADSASALDHLFEFFLDFSVSVSSTSSRQITGVTLDNGDLFAEGDGVSEVIYDILGFGGANDLEIFEAPGFNPASQKSDFESLTATKFLNFEGQIEGNTAAGATAGLSTFSLTFNLQGDTPPPSVVPLPATLPLLLGGVFALGLASRRRSATAVRG